jgi:uncharacterized phage infection (PIP) family protein YhgE
MNMFKLSLQAFLKQPMTKVGIATALLFQVIFSMIWMTGYAGVTDNTKELIVTVVNEDPIMGAFISKELEDSLPFQVTQEPSLDKAKLQLDARDTHMIVHIPAAFTAQVQAATGEQAKINYYINESNPLTIKNVMQSAAVSITAMMNKEAASSGIQAALLQTGISAEQAAAMSDTLAQRVAASFVFSHPVQGMNNQMVPMMLVLASYVGSMIMSMNMQQASQSIGSSVSKWHKFGARALINTCAAVCIGLIGTSLLLLLGGQMESGFLAAWSFQALFLLSFLFFSQIFLILFGNAGMLFNIIALSAQLVSSGAMVPRELLSGFYQGLGDWLPATYAVEGAMNILFGGAGIVFPVYALLTIAGITLIFGAAATAVRRA